MKQIIYFFLEGESLILNGSVLDTYSVFISFVVTAPFWFHLDYLSLIDNLQTDRDI